MSTRPLLLWLLWVGSLAFFGYLLVLAIPLVAPSASVEAVRAVVENGRLAIVAFFGFLGGIIGVLQNRSVKPDDVEDESKVASETHVDDATVDRYKDKLRETVAAATKLRRIASNNARVAIKALSYRAAFSVALVFAICHIASAGIQGLLQRAYPPDELTGVLFFVVVFAQTEMLVLCAIIVPYHKYDEFIREAGHAKSAFSNGCMNRVGGLGLFGVGLISLVTLSPEQISTLLGNQSLRSMPIFKVNYFAYLAALRILVFPLLGIAACYVCRRKHKPNSP